MSCSGYTECVVHDAALRVDGTSLAVLGAPGAVQPLVARPCDGTPGRVLSILGAVSCVLAADWRLVDARITLSP